MKIPLTREKWYELRDDRTNRITKGDFDTHRVGILLNPNQKESFSRQCMTYLACNIMSRWCRNLVIDVPKTPNVLPNQVEPNFKEVIKNSISSIDPFGNFQFDKIDETKVDQILVIGNHEKNYSKPLVWIDSNGWIAGYGTDYNANEFTSENDNHDHNPIGPSFASCLGAAQVFQNAVSYEHSNTEYQKWFGLFDFSTGDPATLQNPEFFTNYDYGTVYQIGCGAVGSSLDTLISFTNWKINIRLIDHDIVSYTNCNRSLPFTPYHALQKKSKVHICGNILQNKNRQVFTIPKTYYEFTFDSLFHKIKPDLILSLANEHNVWSTIQDNYPPMVIHAATTQNWGVNLGRHIPISEWCIMCTYSKFLNDTYKPKCDTGEISTENSQPILGVLPFLSPAAAVMVLAEISKLPFENYPINPNFIDFSMKPPFDFMSNQRGPKKDCVCSEQKPEIYNELHNQSKFWGFCECQ